jgi:hypothetical protein
MAEQAQVEGPIQVRYFPLSKLARAPRNPKSHDLDVINDSITRFGFVNPLVINEKTGRTPGGPIASAFSNLAQRVNTLVIRLCNGPETVA